MGCCAAGSRRRRPPHVQGQFPPTTNTPVWSWCSVLDRSDRAVRVTWHALIGSFGSIRVQFGLFNPPACACSVIYLAGRTQIKNLGWMYIACPILLDCSVSWSRTNTLACPTLCTSRQWNHSSDLKKGLRGTTLHRQRCVAADCFWATDCGDHRGCRQQPLQGKDLSALLVISTPRRQDQ